VAGNLMSSLSHISEHSFLGIGRPEAETTVYEAYFQ
jgi:hypothetical protein